jgi:uncharacterized membrane-anchored protein
MFFLFDFYEIPGFMTCVMSLTSLSILIWIIFLIEFFLISSFNIKLIENCLVIFRHIKLIRSYYIIKIQLDILNNFSLLKCI